MPRTKKASSKPAGNDSLPANKQKGKKVCTCCHENKNMTDFYLSYSPMYSLDKRVPICKECCKSSCLNDDGTINYTKLKELLMHIDKPLYYDQLSSAESSVKKENSYLSEEETSLHGYDILSKYFTLIVMRQDRARSWSDAEKEGFMHTNTNRSMAEIDDIKRKYATLFHEGTNTFDTVKNNRFVHTENDEKVVHVDEDTFEITQEMIDMFGEGYSRIEYRNMYKKYNAMQKNYTIQTNIHKEALLTYVRFKVKEELATARGDVQEAQKWYQAAQDAADKAKLTPKQLSKADLQGGITNFSDIFKAVEEADERIPIFPEFKYRPNDAVDFILWCYINYERNLNNMPEVPYSDIYKFYDEKKKEYIDMYGDPYGIFKNDPTLKNRDTVKKFITVPVEFRERDN